ncbi:DMT family transporter [Pseudomonas cichorii]|uniref:DMT family transporter n=1 Tax=Pseudomonas cichorii TaxID=36746 RepID=UPI001C895A63|nr:DMT family transporter [Pseudomonas cichorii]MBX8517899.1 DMT family transporter [Pseudomonas cichorii]
MLKTKFHNNAVLLVSCLCVVLWSTGFIVGRMIVGSASPNIFLAIRFFLSFLLFTLAAALLKKIWPPLDEWRKHILAGLLINALYLGGSYWAISKGLPAALMALLGALQPLLTVVISIAFLKGRIVPLQALGIFIGLCGVTLVLSPSFQTGNHIDFSFSVLLVAILSVFAITFGTILQKTSLGKSELLPSMAIQNLFSAVAALIFIVFLGESHLIINERFIFSITWAVLVLSGLGTLSLVWLVRNGDMTRTTSLLLLAPPLAALEAWAIFGDKLVPVQIAGFILSLLGVWFCRTTKSTPVTQ